MRRFGTASLLGTAALAGWVMLAARPAQADAVTWASLTSNDGNGVYGAIAAPSGTVGVSYTGSYSAVQLANTGTDFWGSSPVVDAPTDTDIIELTDAGVSTLTFSQAVTNVFIAFNSWNGANVTFSAPFTVISQGCGYWGCGTFDVTTGNQGFQGIGELVGVLEFVGTFTSLSFDDTAAENWHGINVGVSDIASTGVPEPASAAIAGLALAGLGLLRRRRAA